MTTSAFSQYYFAIICFVFVSCVFSQVLELEQQHSTALQELSQTYNTETAQIIEQHQLQLQVHVESGFFLQGALTSTALPSELFSTVYSSCLYCSNSPLEKGLHRVIVHPL